MIEFFCPGKPQQQGSKVKGRYGNLREANTELAGWRERVALAAHTAMGGRPMLDRKTPVEMRMEFVLYRPQATPVSRPTPAATKAPDIDKLVRAVLDALSNVAYADDVQVVRLEVGKRVAEVNEPLGVHVVMLPFIGVSRLATA